MLPKNYRILKHETTNHKGDVIKNEFLIQKRLLWFWWINISTPSCRTSHSTYLVCLCDCIVVFDSAKKAIDHFNNFFVTDDNLWYKGDLIKKRYHVQFDYIVYVNAVRPNYYLGYSRYFPYYSLDAIKEDIDRRIFTTKITTYK